MSYRYRSILNLPIIVGILFVFIGGRDIKSITLKKVLRINIIFFFFLNLYEYDTLVAKAVVS